MAFRRGYIDNPVRAFPTSPGIAAAATSNDIVAAASLDGVTARLTAQSRKPPRPDRS